MNWFRPNKMMIICLVILSSIGCKSTQTKPCNSCASAKSLASADSAIPMIVAYRDPNNQQVLVGTSQEDVSKQANTLAEKPKNLDPVATASPKNTVTSPYSNSVAQSDPTKATLLNTPKLFPIPVDSSKSTASSSLASSQNEKSKNVGLGNQNRLESTKQSSSDATPFRSIDLAPETSKFSSVSDQKIRFAKAKDYSWLIGQLQYDYGHKQWRLRYADIDQEDPYGGVVTLTGGDHLLENCKDGECVKVDGKLVDPDKRVNGAAFRTSNVQAIH